MDNSKQKQSYICKDLHISNCISFERETPNSFTSYMNMRRNEGQLARPHLGFEDGRVDVACVGIDALTTVSNKLPCQNQDKVLSLQVSKPCKKKHALN